MRDFGDLGVRTGDHLGLGISLKSVGRVEGGPIGFLEALNDSIGRTGTIMFPAYTLPSGVRPDYVYDYRTTPAYTGIVPETLRLYPGAIRSKHPVTSVVAFGRYSEFLTVGHDHSAPEYSPYSKLSEINGKVLFIGLGDKLVGIRHEAQYRAGLLDRISYPRKIKYLDDAGRAKKYVRQNKAGCVKSLSLLTEMLRNEGIISDGFVGYAGSILAPAKETLKRLTELLIQRPTLNLCGDINCYWCRQLEWNMNLYHKIEDPKFFQSSRVIRAGLHALNILRLHLGPAASVLRIFRYHRPQG
ncbi:AAC(3) family N-acetyltransferase [Gammaproteobacteria bacterium]|nr:AAC(3) family N-acetyltransferase [Gammaproteobacteria bacterium]